MVAAAASAPSPGPPVELLRAFAATLAADPVQAVRTARAQRVPLPVLDALGGDALPPGLSAAPAWRAAVEQAERTADGLRRAAMAVEAALAGVDGVAIGTPRLGWAWSSDVDVFVSAAAHAEAGRALVAAGAVPLDALRARLAGRESSGDPHLFAVLAAGEVLGLVELNRQLWAGGGDVGRALDRAVPDGPIRRLADADADRRRAVKLSRARRATVRGIAELAVLGAGTRVSRAAVRRHAELARALGTSMRAVGVVPSRRLDAAWVTARLRGSRSLLSVRSRRGQQVRVAFCGVDGAGKSTQARCLAENLTRAGLAAQTSWVRLGNGASAPVEALARAAQRVLPSGSHSFQAARADAGRSAPAGHASVPLAPPLTRRAPLGWFWALAVTLDYLARTHAARRRAAGRVLVLDRALPDALVELEDDYGISLDLRFQRRLLRRWAPRPHLTFYLQLPGSVAKARKDDVFTSAELEVQRARYERLLAELPDVVVLDAQRPRDALAAAVLGRVAVG